MNENFSVYRVLILEDEVEDVHQIQWVLQKAGIEAEYHVSDSELSFRAGLKMFRPHIILADYRLPNFSGLEALAIAQMSEVPAAFIFVTGAIGEELAAETVLSGASGLVLKKNLISLPKVFRRVLDASAEDLRRVETSSRLQSTSARLESQILKNSQLLRKVQTFLSSMPDSDSIQELKSGLKESVEWLEDMKGDKE